MRHSCDFDDLLGKTESENIFGLQHAALLLAKIGSSGFDRAAIVRDTAIEDRFVTRPEFDIAYQVRLAYGAHGDDGSLILKFLRQDLRPALPQAKSTLRKEPELDSL